MRSILFALASLVVAAGCGDDDRGPRYRAWGHATPRPGGTLTFAVGGNVATLDPAHAYDEASLYPLYYLHDTLLGYDGTTLVPALAETWSISPDGLTISFELRDGVVFHDGTPLTAAAFDHAWRRVLRAPDSPFGRFLAPLVGAEAFAAGERDDLPGVRVDGPRRLVLTLAAPDAAFANVLAMKFTAPLVDGAAVTNGTGPFALDAWSAGERVTLRRHPRYWRPGRPHLDAIVMRESVPRELAFLQFERGELDTIDQLTLPDWLWIAAHDGWRPYVHQTPQMSVFGDRFDVTRPPFDDVRVRRALNHAVDKARLVRLLGDRGVPAHGLLPPGLAGRDDELAPYAYDPARARALLAEAGHADGLELEYVLPKDETAERLAQSMQADLAAVGVRVRLRVLSWAAFLDETTRAGGAPFSQTSWFQDYPDASSFLDTRLHSRMIAPDGEPSNNDSFYANPEVDRLLDEARRTRDPSARAAAYRQVERIVHADAPWLFGYHPVGVEVVQPYVRGFALHPVWGRDFRDVWLDLAPDGARVPR